VSSAGTFAAWIGTAAVLIAFSWALEQAGFYFIVVSALSGLAGCVCVILSAVFLVLRRQQDALFTKAGIALVIPFVMSLIMVFFRLSPNVHGVAILVAFVYYALSALIAVLLALFGMIKSAAERYRRNA